MMIYLPFPLAPVSPISIYLLIIVISPWFTKYQLITCHQLVAGLIGGHMHVWGLKLFLIVDIHIKKYFVRAVFDSLVTFWFPGFLDTGLSTADLLYQPLSSYHPDFSEKGDLIKYSTNKFFCSSF